MAEKKNLMEEFGENEIFETPSEENVKNFSKSMIKKMLFEEKVKGDLLIVSGDFDENDPEKIKEFEKKTRKHFLYYEKYFRVSFLHIFLEDDLNKAIEELPNKFFVFFLDSVPEVLMKEFMLNIRTDKYILPYTDKKLSTEFHYGVKYFEYPTQTFLISEKRELWTNSEN